MNNCDYCGEYKKVRKKFTFNGEHLYTENLSVMFFKYVCKECDLALRKLEYTDLIQEQKNKVKKQKNWIKLRDKILEEKK